MTDPVDVHVEALARVLRGPARMRRDMLAETRDGLRDAAERSDPTRAVQEFGPVADIAPHYQAELTAAQGRRTALLVAVLFPALLLGWALFWSHGPWPGRRPYRRRSWCSSWPGRRTWRAPSSPVWRFSC